MPKYDIQNLLDIQSAFIQSAKSMMSAATLEGKMIFANEAMSASLGYSVEEILEMEISDFHSPEISKKFVEAYNPEAIERGIWKGDTILRKKDGTDLNVRQIVFPIRNNKNEIIATAAIMDDITEIMEMERVKQYLQAIINSTSDYVGVSDNDGKTLYHNPGSYKMRGYELFETEEWDRTSPHPKWYLKILQEEGIPTAEEKGKWVGRGELIDRYGKKIPIEQTIFPVYDVHDEPMGLATIIKDITESVKQEKELESAHTMLRKIIDTTPCAIFWKDKNSKFLGGNMQFALDAGLDDPEKLIGRCDHDFFPKEIADKYVADDRKIFATEEDLLYYEEPYEGKDTDKHWISTSKVLLRNNNNQPSSLLGVYDDITDLKQKERELKNAIQSAEEANMAKSDFLSRMSHEIRTPLHAIIGMTEIAKNADNLEKTKESLDAVSAASSHLMGILNDVLDMSKIESGKFILSDNKFDMLVAMNEVADIIKQRCDDKNIEFINDFNMPEKCGIVGDKLRLKQVLINLLGNAVKFTNDEGKILFKIDSEIKGDKVHISYRVQDNGIGISEDQKEHLFDPFEQAHTDVATFGGTGLGLTISQNLIHLMGGDITVDSEIGKGSTFSFELDFDLTDIEEKKPHTPSKVDFGGKRLLLVEDIDINRIIMIELLNSTNITIEEAPDGVEAVKMAENSPEGYYDLIFMDIQMPNMNGYEATTQIRKSDREDLQNIPIVAMTANAYKEDVDKAISAGMNSHLAKPLDIKLVLDTLAKWL